tara:strand:- start:208679 stop:209290 length:612 start_codon:yes stop_codon:yes gene_type:complete
MITIVDYGLGNIKAFANIYKNLNIPYTIANTANELATANKIILPGVGAFDYAMLSLNRSGMREQLDELVLEKKIPVLGICVGMQMMALSSEEGTLPGLGWMNATVKKLRTNGDAGHTPLPHMGWNTVKQTKRNILFDSLEQNAKFYFLHTYYFSCNEDDTIATSIYADQFTSIINHDNVYGIQCHPEKSHQNGIALLKNFEEL